MGWADSWQWSSRRLGMLQMLSWAAAVSWLVPNEGRARGPARFQGLDTEWLGQAFCNVLHLQDPMSRLEAVTLRSSVLSVQIRLRLSQVTHPWPVVALNIWCRDYAVYRTKGTSNFCGATPEYTQARLCANSSHLETEHRSFCNILHMVLCPNLHGLATCCKERLSVVGTGWLSPAHRPTTGITAIFDALSGVA